MVVEARTLINGLLGSSFGAETVTIFPVSVISSVILVATMLTVLVEISKVLVAVLEAIVESATLKLSVVDAVDEVVEVATVGSVEDAVSKTAKIMPG